MIFRGGVGSGPPNSPLDPHMRIWLIGLLQVFDEGSLLEFDVPHLLLQKKSSALYQLVQKAGKTESLHLIQIAADTYMKTMESSSSADIICNKSEVSGTETQQCKL